jgi:hypothetical protein
LVATIESIGQIFKEKKISGVCELCGSGDWHMQQDLDNLAFMGVSPQNTVDSFRPVPVVALICGNCGNMRIFAKRIMEAEK